MLVVIYLAELNGKRYVGQTPRFHQRKREHISDAMNCGGKKCPKFSAAIRKHGGENIQWRVLARVPKFHADEAERQYISLYRSVDPHGYNLTKGGNTGFSGNRRGKKQSPEHIAKRIDAMRKTRWTPEGRREWSEFTKAIGLSKKMLIGKQNRAAL